MDLLIACRNLAQRKVDGGDRTPLRPWVYERYLPYERIFRAAKDLYAESGWVQRSVNEEDTRLQNPRRCLLFATQYPLCTYDTGRRVD